MSISILQYDGSKYRPERRCAAIQLSAWQKRSCRGLYRHQFGCKTSYKLRAGWGVIAGRMFVHCAGNSKRDGIRFWHKEKVG